MVWFPSRFRGFANGDAAEDLVLVDAHLEDGPDHVSFLFGGEYDGIASFGAAPHEEPFGADFALDAPTIWPSTWTPQMAAADFSGDGLLDLAICHGTQDESTWTIYEYADGSWTRNHTGSDGTCARDDYIVLDYDGDQAANILRIEDPADDSQEPYLAMVQDANGAWSEVDTGLPRDMFQRYMDDGIYRYGRGGDVVADITGDGLPDVVRLEPSAGNEVEHAQAAVPDGVGNVVSYVNTGAGFRPGPQMWPLPGEEHIASYYALLSAVVTDVDLNGATDLIVRTSSPDSAFMSLSARPDPNGSVGDYRAHTIPLPDLDEATELLGPFDFNADGLPDLLGNDSPVPNSGNVVPFVHGGARPDLLTKITDGYGAEIEVSYSPLRLVHDRDEDCDDDRGETVECVNDARPVVHFETHDTGTQDEAGNVVARTVEHAYRDGRRHRLGRGWLGFAEHSFSPTDSAAPDTLTRVEMDNHTFDASVGDFPFAHRQKRRTHETEVVDGRRHVLDEVSITTVHPGPDDSTWFPAREFIQVRHYEIPTPPGSCKPHHDCRLDLATLETATPERQTEVTRVFDKFGNVTLLTSSRLGGSTSEIEKTHLNDADRWFLGLVEMRTESSTVRGKTAIRRSAFGYDPTTGALKSSTVSPGHRNVSTTLRQGRREF
jgi:hypothetical protein